MIKNYIKIAWRSLTRQKLYSLINISGLGIGLAVCMLIMLYVTHELSYDKFHANAKRIFALNEHIKMGTQEINMAYTSYASGPIIKQSIPGVAGYMRTRKPFKDVVIESPILANTKFSESKIFFADADFFSFFSFRLLSGGVSNVLSQPFSLVITQDMAKKYFGNENPIGKTLKIKTEDTYQYTVTGVAENVPSNSSIDFNFLASNASLKLMREAKPFLESQLVQGGAFTTYLLLKHPQDSMPVHRAVQSFINGKPGPKDDKFQLIPLTDMHLNTSGDSSNTKYLKIFPLVAGLILLLALVNYMSLSTARSTLRAKEVGVRKVNGASRMSLAAQFYIESALFTCLSFILGYMLCYLFKPWFLNILELKIDTSFLYSSPVLLILSGLLLITVLIAGSYPSIVLSAFKPAVTLKGKMSKQTGGIAVRKVFTTFQFAISVGLIICGIIIDRQLYYFRHTDTGVSRENVVMVPITNSFGKNYQSFKHDVLAIAGVSQAATAHYPMYKGYDMFFLHDKVKKEDMAMPVLSVDRAFIPTLNINWKIPPVSDDIITMPNKVVINETAISKLGLPANPIGEIVDFGGKQQYQVVGVTKNFNFSSLQSTIGPLCLFIAKDTVADWGVSGGCLFAKIKPHTNLPTVISAIETTYKKYDHEKPFSYTFMDDAFNAQYKAEDKLASIFTLFTGITILLATLGLFGLAAFTIEQRTKEIGIRKILGASLSALAAMLSGDFLKLVLLAILVASPFAWWAMHSWLQGFAYRITMQWWMFAAAGVLAVLVAVVTISYHAVRAAIANPVDSLRNE
ncbi:MAG: FtsX-like permease family protein [Mucilaginibacter sp.]|nr:FtsX-like permease family protein [Mucilaginibacter sp.]